MTGDGAKPPIGTYAVDTRTGQVGRVMGHEGPYVQLRPVGGGREWDCPPRAVRAATTTERLRAATAHENARSGGEDP
ncbi:MULTISPECIES: hypothetical protein [Streptomyces]|uniref:Secreted protein n=1 Tax=Streptomyces heilongjiangensis TaxID=945052 RepID=A0ABW1BBF0_9ACTN|nr:MULTISPECIES: hypothetical protein [Streptomyces]MDC2948789.1 hypothetical protein [Streptomyces heilongjiangensis]